MSDNGDKKRSESIEDYLRVIYRLGEHQEKVSTSSIADRLGISSASVTKMLKRLAKEGLLEHVPYKGVSLTESGRKAALRVVRHHRLIELLLTDILGVPWDRVHEEAHRLEHSISDYLEERIAAVLGYPEFDPHGQPIPTRDGEIRKTEMWLLTEVKVGFCGRIAEVNDSDSSLLRYLGERGLYPRTSLELVEREPFGGNVTLQVEDKLISIGSKAAEHIWVALK
jgi:DtxR family Mn-dependent transcriptional regulator